MIQDETDLPTPGKSSTNATRAPEPSAPPSAALHDVPTELTSLRDYEIRRELGRGGMGVVYLAENRLMNRPEVLKVVAKALLDKAGAVDRFLREIQMAAKLKHDNIVAAYSAMHLRGLFVFAMEYVEGDDLSKLVRTHGPLAVDDACEYAHQTAIGLQHAFEKGMVHRDVKPNNLILTRHGDKPLVKILDFGLAKAKSEKADDSELTATGQMMGTPDYAAPEQSLDAKHVDIRADVYSLGCTLFYLLTGRPPYSGRTVFEVMKAHHMTPTPDVRVSRPDVPEDLAAVIRQMMAKTPAERFQTPAEAAEALEPFLKPSTEQPKRRSGASRAVPPDLGAAKTAPETRRPERTRGFRKVLLTVVVVDVVLLLGLAAWWAGVFKQKNPDAMLVVDVDQANPEVLVDGDVVPTVWEPGGKRGELRLSSGKHTVQVKKEGFVVYQEEVDLEAEGRGKLTARLERSLSGDVIEPPPSIDLDLESDVRMELLHIPAGKFVMGSPPTEKERSKDEWQHEVTLTKDFYLGKFEVTRAQFGRFVADEDYKTEAERDDKGGEGYDEKSGKVFFGKQYSWRHTGFIQGDAHPVVNVTWNDATAFCKWLTRKTGRAARLPTEAEWEYACRGGSQTVYNRGSRVAVLEQIANVGDEAFRIKYKDAASTQSWDDGYPFTAPGGKFKSNKFGLYDMHGNVREWCADWYGSYPNDAVTDPEGPTDGSTRVIRGGGFFSVPRECRSAARVSREPTARHPGTGFRVAMPAR